MQKRNDIFEVFKVALPIVLGYIGIGIPCGILSASIGLNVLQVFLLSVLFYSGAGQFMIPNMYLAGNPLVAIIASVSLVNTRQMLYSASLAPFAKSANKILSFFFAASVTDESFGVSFAKFQEGNWSVRNAFLVNLFSLSSWALSNVIGVLVGNAISIPLAIASFAMTSIFICLLCTQKFTLSSLAAAVMAFVGVYVAKVVGLGGAAILVGAIAGVAIAYFIPSKPLRLGKKSASSDCGEGETAASHEGERGEAEAVASHEGERGEAELGDSETVEEGERA